MRKMLIAVDFDGTVASGGYPDITKAEPIEGAVETLKWLISEGHRIILWSCREDHPTDINKKYLTDAEKWMKEHGIEVYAANETPLEEDFRGEEYTTRRKVFADVYVDDAIIGGFPGWDIIKQIIIRINEQK